MARIDKFIAAGFKADADKIVIATRDKATLFANGTTKSMTQQEATRQQVVDIFEEVAPPEASAVAGGGNFDFRYESPSGPVKLSFLNEGETARLEVSYDLDSQPQAAAGPAGAEDPIAMPSIPMAPADEDPVIEAAGMPSPLALGETPPPAPAAPVARTSDDFVIDAAEMDSPLGGNEAPAPAIPLAQTELDAVIETAEGTAVADALAASGPDPKIPAPWETRPEPEEMTSPLSNSQPVVPLPAAPPAAAPAQPAAAAPREAAGFVPRPMNPAALQKMEALLTQMVEEGCSDLHVTSDTTPLFRKDGHVVPLGSNPEIPAREMEELLHSIAPAKSQEEFSRRHDADFAYEIKGVARFRCNIFMDRLGPGGVFRVIPSKIPSAKDLGLNEATLGLCNLSKGLVLVTGPTGSGKSTTLAAMIDHINASRTEHIITIEDPIEFVHPRKKCLVNQRQVGVHTEGFKSALRAALREDPDIILVGELRDLETIAIAIETAETGHLVFGTLHTNTAPSTVDRIIDQFPTDRQAQVRTMLSESLKGVIAQTLCRKKGGGRVAAHEILLVTSAISNLIREGKTFQIPSLMQTGKGIGMKTLNDSLLELAKAGIIEPDEALAKAVDKASMQSMLGRKQPAAAVAAAP